VLVKVSTFVVTAARKGMAENHFVIMNQDDINRLKPGEWLNDCLIDFWMMWITRKEPADENRVHIFNTQFHTSMVEKGVDHVLQCNQKRNLDVFSKKRCLSCKCINNYTGLYVAFLIQEPLLAAMMKSIPSWKFVSSYSLIH
jgi:hypothetical protein